MLERAKDLARLEQALRPPKARGGFGELLLENLLRDRLPPSAYEMQYTFDSGERVDAIVRADRMIPVDSKFPLDNYIRLADAETDDERQLAERQFGRDVKQHIDAIAAKYIRPDEGTYDFAFMYIPVEGGVLRARVRQDRGAALVRSRTPGLPGFADDVHRVPAGDRTRTARHADRGARARGDGVRRRSPARLRPFRRRLRQGRHAYRPCAVQVPRGRQAPGQVRDKARACGRGAGRARGRDRARAPGVSADAA